MKKLFRLPMSADAVALAAAWLGAALVFLAAPTPVGAQTPTVTGYNGTQTFVTAVGKDPAEPNACGVVGGASYWFMWQPPADGIASVNTAGSTFDTVLGIYVDNGQNLGYSSLVAVTCNDDCSAGVKTSCVSWPASARTNYYIMLDGVNAATGTAYMNYSLATTPTIGAIGNKTIDMNTGTGALAFNVSDPTYAANSLTLTGISTNQTLVPAANIVFGGSGVSRTVTVTPATNQVGTNTITIVIANPGGMTNNTSFVLSVVPPSFNPTISTITNKTINLNTNTGNLTFTISDPNYAASNLTLVGISTNQTLVSSTNIVFGGTNGNRTVMVTPNANQFGTNSITVVVADPAGLTNKTSFVLSVTAPAAPAISTITNKAITINTNTGNLPFTISNAGFAATNLTLTGISTNQSLVANTNIVFGGSNTNRTVMVTPNANMFGTNTITVVVANPAGLTNKTSFVLSVAAPVAPTISTITNKTINVNTNTGNLAFTIGNVGYAGSSLTLTGISTNQTLVANTNIVFGGSNTNRTVMVTPNANKFGTNTITIVVANPVGLTNKTSFVLSVTAPAAPTISAITNKTINANTNTGNLAFTISNVGYAATNLTLTGISTNQTLVATTNIVFGGSNTNRTVMVTPNTNQFGTNTITVVVTNPAGLTNKTSFVLSVLHP